MPPWGEGHSFHRAHDRGGSYDRGVPAPHAAAARRLPLRLAADDPAPDPLGATPLSAAPWDKPVAGDGGRQTGEEEFKAYPIGYFHIDIAEVRTGEGKLYLFVAIDRTSKLAFARLADKANTVTATAFLDELVEAVPYTIHTVLTDNGIQFADLPKNRNGPTARWRGHPFDRACWRQEIEHRLTKPNHPWTNGQVERMNRTIKDATVKRYHLRLFIDAYNHARRLKTLRGLTPFEYVARVWTEEPERFKIDPYHRSAGPNT